MKRYFLLFVAVIFLLQQGFSQYNGVTKPVPPQSQLVWQNMEFYFFAHFGPNTFPDLEWEKARRTQKFLIPKSWIVINGAASQKPRELKEL